MNKDLFTKDEIKFILDLNKKLKKRSDNFYKENKRVVFNIIDKLNNQLIIKEIPIMNKL